MSLAKRKRQQDQARQFWLDAKKHLESVVQPGNRRAFASGISRDAFSTALSGGPKSSQQSLTLKDGRSVQDADVDAYIAQLGGNPYAAKMKAAGQAGGSQGGNAQLARLKAQSGYDNPATASQQSDPMALFNQVLAQQEAGYAEAKAANEGRYAEGKGILQDTGAYRQELAKNWGKSAQADIDERMKESLKDTQANLASRGLSNSTVMDAFRTRTARDTAREQQRVTEMRDARLGDVAAQDAGNLAGWIERRSDPYPDRSEALRLAAQTGQLQMQQQEQAAQREAQARAAALSRRQTAQPTQLPPTPGPRGVAPAFVNFAPVQMGMGMLAGNYMAPRPVIAKKRGRARLTRAQKKAAVDKVMKLPTSNPLNWGFFPTGNNMTTPLDTIKRNGVPVVPAGGISPAIPFRR